MRNLVCLILLQVIIVNSHINLYWVSNNNENEFEHDCIRLTAAMTQLTTNREIISYCMSESPWKFKIEEEDFFPKFTFAELSKEKITSQQLYHWSVPIDIIERYQSYLNQLSDSSLAGSEILYNCTWPRFGPQCQYEIDHYHSSLPNIIRDFYRTYVYQPTTLTCYQHLQCDRGPSPSCLDWSEVCDGKIDCLPNGLDEEHCWLLEINECQDDEYRCSNGQCIPQSFYRDDGYVFDCLDGSDEIQRHGQTLLLCNEKEPSFGCEDVTCPSTFMTKSCVSKRTYLLMDAIYFSQDTTVSQDCWPAFRCIIDAPNPEWMSCNQTCATKSCLEIVREACPEMLVIPNSPILFGNAYLAYAKNDSKYLAGSGRFLVYLCYNNSYYDDYFKRSAKVLFDNMTCFRLQEPSERQEPTWPQDILMSMYYAVLNGFYASLKQYHFVFNYSSEMCNRSSMYQCIGSLKCISNHRLLDAVNDCPHGDDENFTIIDNLEVMKRLKQNYFQCETSNKYISQVLITDGRCDCEQFSSIWCEDEDLQVNFIKKNISFQTTCDGFVELMPVMIDGRNETDETECEQWQCNNIYTRCNGLWNCFNGLDEIGCETWPLLNCSPDQHFCVSPETNQLMCLPVQKANDGYADCLSGTDEPTLCRLVTGEAYSRRFYCRKPSWQSCLYPGSICNGREDCEQGDDEQFCTIDRFQVKPFGLCSTESLQNASNTEKFLCRHVSSRHIKPQIVYFSLANKLPSAQNLPKNIEKTMVSSLSIVSKSPLRCHRGLDLRVWLNNRGKLPAYTCLCPPSFYGDQCQYQNQRISLAIKFRALSDSRHTLFAIIISLIDNTDERTIHSFEQFTYLSVRDCQIKFHIYLLYSTRPKNTTKQYSVHMDIYEKVSLVHRGSLLFPVHFPFLPVHRLAFIVDIPGSNNHVSSCSHNQCVHGRCIKYSNKLSSQTFCQCDRGWSGRYCTIQHRCTCSFDSLCLGIDANNRSICICPINKFGSRCFLIDSICRMNDNSTCQNGGQCIPEDDYNMFNRKFVCVCRKGFSGDRCEIADSKLILSFEKDIVVSQSIFIHFIEIFNNSAPVRTTHLRMIPMIKQSMMIYWSRPFHLMFIELLHKTYYLSPLQQINNQSITINSSDRCLPINELFNESFVRLHLLRRIKSYHIPCQNASFNLSCFYDDVHFCLCYDFHGKRLADCFHFNHQMTFDCLGQSECENGGQCFQDTVNCPQRSICVCPRCFYGTRCQFSTNGFSLSLDAILGYHILPHMSLGNQPFIVKFSLGLAIVYMILGLINGILSWMTFKRQVVREVGCGLYLLSSSITTLLTMIMFELKFLILILAQMAVISNRSFLQIQCISLDFLLRVCLSMVQWLDACVAIERALTTIKGTRFVKKKSRQVAKKVLILLVLLVVATSIHDPISRRLINEENDDDDETRTWCIVTYQSHLQVYNTVMNIFHFFAPFLINAISAIILLTKKSRQQANMQTHRTFRELLIKQLRQHKHLFTAPVLLVILALPRLIISLVSKCMTSSHESWLFLGGYFISFIPPILTFVLFVLPSKFYKKEFRKTVVHYRTNLRQRLYRYSN